MQYMPVDYKLFGFGFFGIKGANEAYNKPSRQFKPVVRKLPKERSISTLPV